MAPPNPISAITFVVTSALWCRPSARLRLINVNLIPGLTLKSRVALRPLIVTTWPEPSRMASLETVISLVSAIVPSQANVTSVQGHHQICLSAVRDDAAAARSRKREAHQGPY